MAGSANVAGSAAAAALRAAEQWLIARVGHWNASRWSAGGAGHRADVVFALVQALADACAEVERRAPRAVPRFATDLALPDQVRVMVGDLLRAGAPDEVLAAAAASIEATLSSLEALS